MSFHTTGRKEVTENVLTALLSTVATSLAAWAIDTLKAKAAEKKAATKKKSESKL